MKVSMTGRAQAAGREQDWGALSVSHCGCALGTVTAPNGSLLEGHLGSAGETFPV